MSVKRFVLPATGKNEGFSLIECVIAILVTTIGLLAIANLAAVAVRTEVFAYHSVEASTLASGKIEDIKAGSLVNGGSLTGNQSGYNDNPTAFFARRWQITDGPAGTKIVSVVVFSPNSAYQVRATRIDTLVR